MTISVTARAAMYAQETGEAFLIPLTINHPDFASPIRVVNNTEDINSGGDDYVAYAFELVLPSSGDDQDLIARLTIDNVSREITQAIRLIDEPPTVDVSVVRYDETISPPDWVPEVTLPTFTLRNVVWDALTITGDLVLRDITTEPWPQYTFDPGRFPALF